MLSLAAAAATAVLTALLLRPGGRPGRLTRRRPLAGLLEEAGLDWPVARLQAVRLLSAAAIFAALRALTGSWAVAIPPAVAAWRLPLTLLLRRRLLRRRALQVAWPDALRDLGASVSAGMSLPQAVAALATSGPQEIHAAFARVPALLPALGFRATLETVRQRAADPTTDRVVEVLLLAQERGGRVLPELLADLAEDTTRELHLIERISTAQLELRINARAVFALPWLVLATLTARPGPFRDFYGTRAGAAVIGLAAVLSAAGTTIVERLGRIPLEPRVLDGRGVR